MMKVVTAGKTMTGCMTILQNNECNLTTISDHVFKEPIVNKVCLCFPLSFLPLFVCVVFAVAVAAVAVATPDDTAPSPTSPRSSTTLARPPPPLAPSPIDDQAETTGPFVLPNIFFNDTLPLTCGFVLDAAKLGNSGKSVLESFDDDDDDDPLIDEGVGRFPSKDEDADAAAAELPDHGVLRCA
jgi:hypothetical protein